MSRTTKKQINELVKYANSRLESRKKRIELKHEYGMYVLYTIENNKTEFEIFKSKELKDIKIFILGINYVFF